MFNNSKCKDHVLLMNFIQLSQQSSFTIILHRRRLSKSNRKAMNRNWSNQKANPALKTKAGNKKKHDLLKEFKSQFESSSNDENVSVS